MDAVEEEGRADVAVGDRLTHREVGAVEAAHEADLDEAAAEGDLGVDDAVAGGLGGGERLLAEDRLAGGDGAEDVFLVRRAPGAHDDGLDFGVAITSRPVACARAVPRRSAAPRARRRRCR